MAGNIVSWEQSGECNVGYRLGKEYWGKGIASAALSLFQTQFQKRPLYAHVAKHNAGSIRVLQKCGFIISRDGEFSGMDGKKGEEYVMMLARVFPTNYPRRRETPTQIRLLKIRHF